MSEERANYVAVGPVVENEANRIAMLLGRADLACRTLEGLMPLARLPWAVEAEIGYGVGSGPSMFHGRPWRVVDTADQGVATLWDTTPDRDGIAPRYALEALTQVPHLVPALRHLLDKERARASAEREENDVLRVGTYAIAAARARHALDAHDAESDRLGDTRAQYPDPGENNRFWLLRGAVRGVLYRAVELAEWALREITEGHADEADRARRLAEAERVGTASEMQRRALQATKGWQP